MNVEIILHFITGGNKKWESALGDNATLYLFWTTSHIL